MSAQPPIVSPGPSPPRLRPGTFSAAGWLCQDCWGPLRQARPASQGGGCPSAGARWAGEGEGAGVRAGCRATGVRWATRWRWRCPSQRSGRAAWRARASACQRVQRVARRTAVPILPLPQVHPVRPYDRLHHLASQRLASRRLPRSRTGSGQ
eukprot:scaffold16087_cov112-Isochrysis_galbana.AAC.4